MHLHALSYVGLGVVGLGLRWLVWPGLGLGWPGSELAWVWVGLTVAGLSPNQ